MSLVGIFSRSRPEIDGLFFDALLEESSELVTDVTEYPIETGAIGNDHAVTRPLRLTMTVALSDNPIKAAMAEATGNFSGIGGALLGTAVGAVIGQLGGAADAAVGIAGSVLTELAGGAETRSGKMIKAIRALQSAHKLITVVGAKDSYDNVLITNTRVQVNKQNEGGLELVVEMRKLLIVDNKANQAVVNKNLPAGDTSSTQGQTETNLGEVGAQ
ncbi:MAG: phage baseplate protein [Pigmentiphaga sp.]